LHEQGILRSVTDASKDSRVLDYVNMVSLWGNVFHICYSHDIVVFPWKLNCYYLCLQVSSIQYRKLDFEEFCAAAISVHQLEGMESWEQHARRAYELFEKEGNRPIMIEELASVLLLFQYLFFSNINKHYISNFDFHVCRESEPMNCNKPLRKRPNNHHFLTCTYSKFNVSRGGYPFICAFHIQCHFKRAFYGSLYLKPDSWWPTCCFYWVQILYRSFWRCHLSNINIKLSVNQCILKIKSRKI